MPSKIKPSYQPMQLFNFSIYSQNFNKMLDYSFCSFLSVFNRRFPQQTVTNLWWFWGGPSLMSLGTPALDNQTIWVWSSWYLIYSWIHLHEVIQCRSLRICRRVKARLGWNHSEFLNLDDASRPPALLQLSWCLYIEINSKNIQTSTIQTDLPIRTLFEWQTNTVWKWNSI